MNTSQSVLVSIIVNANVAQASSQFNNLMLQISVSSRNSAQSAANSFSTIFGANFFANLAAEAARAFTTGLAGGLANMSMFAARTEELEVALNGLSKVNGINSDSLRDYEKSLKDANIATQTARESLTKFIAAGLDLNKLSGSNGLAEVSKNLAVISGVSSSEELDRLINGITTLQVRVLRTAGVYVSLQEAEKNYAKQHGVTLQSLSTEEKQQIALNAVLEFGTRAHGLYDEAMTTTAKKMRSLERQQQDFADAVEGKLVPVLGLAVDAYSALLNIGAKTPTAFIVATASLGLLATAITLTTTNFSALTLAQITNAAASTNFVKLIQTAILVMQDFRLASALTAGEIALLSGGLLAVVGVVGSVIYALYSYNKAQSETASLTKDQLATNVERQRGLQSEISFLSSLTPHVAANAAEQSRLNQMYLALNPQAQARIGFIKEETEKTKALIAEKLHLAQISAIALQAEGTSRVQALANAISRQNMLTNQQEALAERFTNAGTLSIQGSDSAIVGREERIREKAIADTAALSTKMSEQQEEVRKAAVKVAEYNEITGQSNDKTILLAQSTTKLGVENNVLLNTINSVAAGQKNNAVATNQATDSIRKMIDEYRNLSDAAERAKTRNADIQDLVTRVADQYVNQTKPQTYSRPGDKVTIKTPAQLLRDQMNHYPELQGMISDAQKFKEAQTEINKIIDPTKIHQQKTASESLAGSLKKLRDELSSYSNLNSKDFSNRFEKEELERVKRDYEQIISLRRELNMPLNSPLPSNAGAAQAMIKDLERVKSARDGILKIIDEQKDAEVKLAQAQIGSNLSVVNARTLADTAYFDGLRKRREGEEQLTADIITQIRQREDLQLNATRNIANAQTEATKDYLTQENTRDETRMKELAKLQILAGDVFKNNPLIDTANRNARSPETNPVVVRLDTSNDLLNKILNAVSGGTGGGDGASAQPFTGRSSNWNYKSIGQFINSQGFHVSKNGGFVKSGHNKNSLHYLGLADDVSIAGRSTADIEMLMENAIRAGIRVVDERTRPKPGAVWSAPHIHLEANSKRASFLPRNLAMAQLERSLSGGNSLVAKTVMQAQAVGMQRSSATRPRIADNLDDFSGISDNLPQANLIANSYFGMNANRLPLESVQALNKYLETLKLANKETASGLRTNAIGQDRLNQSLDYQVKSVRDLAVSQSNLDDLRNRKSLPVLLLLRNAEINRNKEAANAQATIIETERFMQLFDKRDPKVMEYLSDLYRAGNATATRSAATEGYNARQFVSDYNAGSPDVTRLLDEQFKTSRAVNIKNLTTDVDTQRRIAATGGRDPVVERLETQREYLTTINSVGQAEAHLEQQRALNGNADFVRSRRAADVIGERADLEKQLAQIEDERATSPYNQALRERVAREDELLKIQRADLDAQTQIARLEVDIADKTVVHQTQINAKVLDHLNSVKSLTDVYADSKNAIVDGVWGGIDKLTTKLSGNIPVVSAYLKEMISGILKLFALPLMQRLLGVGSQPQAQSAGGGNPFSSGSGAGSNPLTSLFNFLSPSSGGNGGGGIGGSYGGGVSPTNPYIYSFTGGGAAQATNANLFGGGSSTPNFGALFSQLNPIFSGTTGSGEDLINDIKAGGIGGGNMTSNATRPRVVPTAGKFDLGSLLSGIGFGQKPGSGGAVASMLPLLGLSAGSQLGGSSAFGSIIGGAGGLLLGAGLTAAPTALAGTFLAPLFSNPITAVVGGALLVGALLLGRDKKRKEQEKQRTEYLQGAYASLDKLSADVTAGLDFNSAQTQAKQILATYQQQANSLSDSKTRGIAIQEIAINIQPRIDRILAAAKKGDTRRAFASAQDNAIVPTFDSGGSANYGIMRAGMFSGYGGQSYGDVVPAYVKRNEAILAPENIAALGGFDALRRAGVRGMEMYPRSSGYSDVRPSVSSGGSAQAQYNLFYFDEESASKAFDKVKASGVAKKVRISVFNGDDAGLTKTLKQKFTGQLP